MQENDNEIIHARINLTKRLAFEASMYDHYYAQTVGEAARQNATAQLVNREDFFKLKEDGSYLNAPLNFALIGYDMGIKDVIDQLVAEDILTDSKKGK